MSVPSLVASLMAVALASAGATATTPAASANALCRNGFYLVPEKRLIRFDEHAIDRLPTASLGDHVNALAYVESEELLYGIAESAGVSRVVTVDGNGAVVDRGAAPKEIDGAYAGASDGTRWIVHSGHEVVTVDVPGLTIASKAKLPNGFDVGDWDLYRGMLYGVTTGSAARLTKTDPVTGETVVVAVLPGMPKGSSYGAAAVDPYGVLHALHNGTGRLYHIPLADPARFTMTEENLPAFHADAASCPLSLDAAEAPAAQHTRTTIGELTLGTPAPVTIAAEAASFTLKVPLANTTPRDALLAGWHDLNHDGRFTTDERAIATVPPGTAEATLAWPTVKVGVQQDLSRVRLRLYGFPKGEAVAEGPASGGEVQDHPLRIVWPRPRPAPVPPPSASPAPVPPTPSASPPPTAAAPRPLPQPPSRKLPLTLSLFAGMLVPAITIAARGGGRRGAA